MEEHTERPTDDMAEHVDSAKTFAKFDAAFKVAKFSDPPHPIAIILGLLSPVLGIAALIISLSSYRLSVKSIEISQRAYLTIRNSVIDIDINFPQFALERTTGSAAKGFANAAATFEIANTGNTPAVVTAIEATFDAPSEWLQRVGTGVPNTLRITDVGDVAPKTSVFVRRRLSAFYDLRKETVDGLRNNLVNAESNIGLYISIYSPFRFEANLSYVDVFNRTYNLKWCNAGILMPGTGSDGGTLTLLRCDSSSDSKP